MTTYEEIGRAFVLALCASDALGHVSGTGLSDYSNADDLPEAPALVVNAFAAARLDDRAPRARAAVAEWLATSELATESKRRGAEAAGRIG
jgi:hypothetical protein